MIYDYIDHPDLAYISEEKQYHQYEIGYNIKFLEEDIFDFSPYNIVIVGVKEAREAGMKNLSSDLAPDEIRKQFYRLNICNQFPKVLDIGNIKDGETIEESYERLEYVLAFFYDLEIPILILGGSQDLTYVQFKAYADYKKKVSMTVVDERIDLKSNQKHITSDGFLQEIIACESPNLYHYTHFGYQSYYTNYTVVDTLQSMFYEPIRLGTIRYKIPSFNHVFRMSDMVSIDISSVKQADAPARSMQSPNGLTADELCQIARICGMSDGVNSFGIYEVNPQLDFRNSTSQLVAQALWYFIEGFTYREVEYPSEAENENFTIFIIEMSEFGEKPFHFWHSKFSKNWWVQIPNQDKDTSYFFPCGKEDYDKCSNGEISTWIFNLISKVL